MTAVLKARGAPKGESHSSRLPGGGAIICAPTGPEHGSAVYNGAVPEIAGPAQILLLLARSFGAVVDELKGAPV
jgi:hypothetical protein